MQITSAIVPTRWVCSRTLRAVVYTVPKQRAGRITQPLGTTGQTEKCTHGFSRYMRARSGKTLVRGPAVTTKGKDTGIFIRKLSLSQF